MRISSVYALCHLMILNTCRLKEEIHVAPKKERRDRNERRRESRGRRKERPQTIQSHSIFEQGPADSVRKTGAHPQPSAHCVVFLQTAFPLHRAQSVLLPTGWHGAAHLQEAASSPVCKLLKKERKETKEEDEDEILSKLQRDDVSASCFIPVKL